MKEFEAANQLTKESGLSLNVNIFRRHMKEYFINQDVKPPVFSRSHVAMSAAIESLASYLAKNFSDYAEKNNTGLRSLPRKSLRYCILLDENLREFYYWPINKFDKDQNYTNQVPIDQKELAHVLNKVDPELNLTKKALNLFNYLLLKSYLSILNTSYQ